MKALTPPQIRALQVLSAFPPNHVQRGHITYAFSSTPTINGAVARALNAIGLTKEGPSAIPGVWFVNLTPEGRKALESLKP